jgi:hypothetical protein
MAFSITRLICLENNGYNSVHAYVSDGSDRGSTIAAAGFFNSAYLNLRAGDIILAGVTCGGGVSCFVVSHQNVSGGGVSINGA